MIPKVPKPKVKSPYDHKYRKKRERILTANPFCQVCLLEQQLGIRPVANFANQIHHIDHDATNNKDENLLPICKMHHDQHHK